MNCLTEDKSSELALKENNNKNIPKYKLFSGKKKKYKKLKLKLIKPKR